MEPQRIQTTHISPTRPQLVLAHSSEPKGWRSVYDVAKLIIKDLDDAILAGRVKLD